MRVWVDHIYVEGGRRFMQATRPFVTASAALLAAGAVAIAPTAPPTPDVRIASPAVRLTADSQSIANIPANVIQAIVNIPAAQLVAMEGLADGLFYSGSWWTGRANQIWGTNPSDPPTWKAGVALLVPFPALSDPLGEQVAIWAQAEFPVNADCAYICYNPIPILVGLNRVPLWQLIAGYTFPTVVNPLGPVESQFGLPGTGPGNTMPWSGQTVRINPLDLVTGVTDYLLAPPTGVKAVTVGDILTTSSRLLEAVVGSFSPFTPGGPFDAPGWPYSEAACPVCSDITGVSPSGRIIMNVINAGNTVLNAVIDKIGITVDKNAVITVDKNAVNDRRKERRRHPRREDRRRHGRRQERRRYRRQEEPRREELRRHRRRQPRRRRTSSRRTSSRRTG